MTSANNTYPVFSIITPTFRRPELLSRNIRSVLAQTYVNFEHIIIDDGNDPATEMIVRSFNDERLVLFKHEESRGAAASYNTGMKAAKGELISFLDDDDEYKPEYLQRIQEKFLNSGACGFIWTGIERVLDSETGEKIISKLLWPSVFTNRERGLIAATSIGNGYGVCVKKKCIDDTGFYDENMVVAEDTDFLIRLSQKNEFQTIPEVLVRLHRHESNQLTRNENFKERIHGKETILKRHKAFFERYPLLYTEHYRGYAGLCYKSGLKKKGRNAFLSILGKSPFKIIVYLDFLILELTGNLFSEINFIRKIKAILR